MPKLKHKLSITSLFTTTLAASLLLSSLFTSHLVSANNRVVSAGAGITELVLALDAGDELVGVDSTSQLPNTMASVAVLGYHRMLSAEGILALSPTLVLGSDAMGPQTTLTILSSANVAVTTLPSAETKTQLLANIEQMGQLLNRNNQAIKLAAQIEQSFARLEAKQQQVTAMGKVPKVLFLLLQQDRPARVGGSNTAADIIIKLAGGQNIAGFDGYKSVSQEGILAMQPDMILISNRSNEQTQTAAKTLLTKMPLLHHTPAGENNHIKSLPPQALLGGLGLSAIEAAELLASDFISLKKH
ncbi:hemin ABC transporter substrate-binding protein [Shewanella vesiculosa]|jgi:iron complex transport system substrate-binding protein|uniref:heme/hemin ABC transporter substrate-binding protein n=1 Tax=Shewanella vesiculosa TaxID=518738 RepID=UPI000F50BD59|nr:ABC transporter substrate-binding protein [Shewanella vesiculosa]RPA51209.1 hemin ABC transporter substrate-binding protein [Shewanella vesiculosa]UJL43084.1 ABC transporter substrate-binding protein [Shewanella vesiculosa]